jgi:hypothetical protein
MQCVSLLVLVTILASAAIAKLLSGGVSESHDSSRSRN